MVRQWAKRTKTAKLNATDKAKIFAIVRLFVSPSSKSRLSEIVYRFEIKAGRVYLYSLREQFGWADPDMQFIKPLIDGKYVEFPMARITLFDVGGEKCEVNWQRFSGEWISLSEGNLAECLEYIEKNDDMFYELNFRSLISASRP